MKLYKEQAHGSLSTGDFFICINHRDIHGVMVDPHWHDFYEILYILDGEVSQIIDDSTVRLVKGDIVMIAPSHIHATKSLTDHCYILVLLVMPNVFADMTSNICGGYLQSPYQFEKEVKQLFCRMNEEFTLKQTGYQTIVKGCIYEVLGYLNRNNCVLPQRHPEKLMDIQHIFSYIEENMDKPLYLKDVAKIAGYSEHYFSKYFKKITGKTLKNYIDHAKMLQAKRMILFEGLTVRDTASRLGYEDVSSFCRAFKRLNGYPPSSLLVQNSKRQEMHNKDSFLLL